MQDRISQHPGRIKLTPVPGQANTYDMVRADDAVQAGTPLSKGNIFPDEAALGFGLPTDSGTAGDALKMLSKVTDYHLWDCGVEEIQAVKTGKVVGAARSFQANFSDDIVIRNGKIELAAPISTDYMRPEYVGKYVDTTPLWGDSFGVCLLKSGGSDGYKFEVLRAENVFVHEKYAYSLNRDAYPDNGQQAGKYYRYRGIFGSGLHIASGQYIGTGTDSVTLAFPSAPYVIFITSAQQSAVIIATGKDASGPDTSYKLASFVVLNRTNVSTVTVSVTGGTVTWEGTQMQGHSSVNSMNTVYRWIAIMP